MVSVKGVLTFEHILAGTRCQLLMSDKYRINAKKPTPAQIRKIAKEVYKTVDFLCYTRDDLVEIVELVYMEWLMLQYEIRHRKAA